MFILMREKFSREKIPSSIKKKEEISKAIWI